MGSRKKTQYLVRSFIFGAAALTAACGGSSELEPSPLAQAGSGGQVGAPISSSSSGASSSPGSDGADDPPPALGAPGGAGGRATVTPSTPCPTALPVAGSACVPAPDVPTECHYPTHDPCSLTSALCIFGSWVHRPGDAIACTGDGGAGGGPPLDFGGQGPDDSMLAGSAGQ